MLHPLHICRSSYFSIGNNVNSGWLQQDIAHLKKQILLATTTSTVVFCGVWFFLLLMFWF